MNFSSVCNKPDNKTGLYAVGTDKTIKEIEKAENNVVKEKLRYEAGLNIS